MNSEISPSSSLAALPVRRRETLEIFDTALKLYRRYFWVLLAWSAIVSVTALTSFLSGPLYLLTMPFLYGSVSCCVAAAVRGQGVGFRQCWAFSKPRYGAMLGTILLSWLIFSAFMLGLFLAMTLLGVLGVWIFSNTPEPVQIVAAVLGFVAVTVLSLVLGAVAFGWMNMVPIVACLEDDKRGTAAIGRAFELLKGQWRRVFGMFLLLSLAIFAVMAIIGGIYGLLNWGALQEIFGSNFSSNGLTGLLLTFSGFMTLFFVLWNPAQNLVIAVLYLDLRVRREALDLEWTAYSSAPAGVPLGAGQSEAALPPQVQAVENTSLTPAALGVSVETPSSFGASPSTIAPNGGPTGFSSRAVELKSENRAEEAEID